MDNKDKEEPNNKKPRKTNNKIIKSIKISSLDDPNKTIGGFEDLSKEELIEVLNSTIEQMAEISIKLNERESHFNLSMIKAKQDLDMNAHDVQRKRLFTLFDIINNTKELLIHKLNDMGVSYELHNITSSVKDVANDTINLALEQIHTWIKNNDINKIKPENYETEKNPSIDSLIDDIKSKL